MIDNQLRPSGVNADFVLRRMKEVAREDFVPADARGFAYMDRPIALGGERWLASPLFHGLALQAARPRPADRTLLVDGGSGYLAELLRPMVGTLAVVDPATAAEGTADPSEGGYTLLLIEGAVEHIPSALVALLAPDARVVSGVLRDGVTHLTIGRPVSGDVALLPVAELGIPVLTEFCLPKRWSF